MKRSRDDKSPSAAAGDERGGPYRRQLPVSCLFCRSKKLKCDREQPCSNCVARNIECASAVSGKPVTSSDGLGNIGLKGRPVSNLSNSDIAARLARLEQAVFRGNPPESTDSFESYASHIGSLDNLMHTPTGWQSIGGALPSRSREYLNQATHQLSPQDIEGSPKAASGSEVDPSKDTLPIPAAPAVQDLSQLMLRTSKYEAFLLGNPEPNNLELSGSSSRLSAYEISTILPSQPVAEVLFHHFDKNVCWVYRIIHAPTNLDDMRMIYHSIRNNTDAISPNKLALVAVILAVAAHFWYPEPGIALTAETAKLLSVKWRELAEKALEEAQHDTQPSLETIQASILMSQFLPGKDANAKRAMLGYILHCARLLGLHQTDSKRNCQRRMGTEPNLAELEMRRRVWWHIVCTDWMLSYMSGPQEGTYFCHPNQMNVLLPSNADDENITPTSVTAVDFIGPETPPTEMTYTLAKFWFAEIVRSFVDTACAAGLEVDELEYDQVVKLDEQANRAIKELPYYFQLDEVSRKRSVEIDKQRPYIAWQREMLHFGFHTRLSRLHRPFMTRGYKDPKYAYSRMICLRSARIVLELERSMRESKNGMHQQTTSRLWIIVHHVFMATVTLVMDYCCHRDDPRAAERRAEILECYKILERSNEESSIAKKGLAHLKNVMNEWRAETANDRQLEQASTGDNMSVPAVQQQPQAAQSNFATTQPIGSADMMPMYDTNGMSYMGGMDMSGIDLAQELWFDDGAFAANFDPQWDALFNILENQPGIYGM